jgi:hypothetical protein
MQATFRIGRLFVDAGFKDFLNTVPNRVSDIILGFENMSDQVNFIGITDKPDTISYLPASKVETILDNKIDPYSDGIGRGTMKIGRLLGKIFPKNIIKEYISSSDVENFVNLFKAFFDNTNKKMVVVEGDDIKKYYIADSYFYPEYGSLWKSCMRYSKCRYFLDIYTKNPDKVKMVVMLSEQDGVDKVKGRALIWEAEDLNGNKVRVMDRIYTVYDSDTAIFKRWARENGYIPKYYQSAKAQNIFEVDGKEQVLDLKIVLSNNQFTYYPYLDSFQFFNTGSAVSPNGILFNSSHHSYWDYQLIQGDGSPYRIEEDQEPEFDDDWGNDD